MQIFFRIFYIFWHFLHKSRLFCQFFHLLPLLPRLFRLLKQVSDIARQNEQIVAQTVHKFLFLFSGIVFGILECADTSFCTSANRPTHMTSADGLATCRQNEGSLLRYLCLHHIDPLLQLLHIRFLDPLTSEL